MKDIADRDYTHANRFCKKFQIKNLDEYHDLYIQIDKLLLPDLFNNFWNTFLQIYELDPPHFFLHNH